MLECLNRSKYAIKFISYIKFELFRVTLDIVPFISIRDLVYKFYVLTFKLNSYYSLYMIICYIGNIEVF